MKKILYIILVCLITSSVKAQVLPVNGVQLNLSTVVEHVIPNAVMDTLTNPFYLLQQDSSLKVALSFKLQDSNQVAKINITLGTTTGGAELMTHSFVYDNVTPGAGLSYTRKKNFIILGLGEHVNAGFALYYAGVEIEDANGNKSIIKQADTAH